ncbi:FAD binding domain-containing protein [Trichodelitschia bisporula]|uniref:FAD binding domain-containing protein n=1 Tax=Trichodelitschia bisporula TaxID=703511 RepID=A0A6G1HV81_9PEZI|nr:FAD binding domain-containing protein [Trichodelitschia bisporula]
MKLPTLVSLVLPALVAADTCATLASQNPEITQLKRSDKAFTPTLSYWSAACAAQQPSCILLPKSSSEVSTIIRALGTTTEPFAVKSGGHNPNCGFASVAGGPLVSLQYLNEVAYDAAARTVRVGPGNRWHNVSAALQGTGMTVVGGRMGEVGVGGYMLGGGLSFLSGQYGWAADNVVAYEVVLADGRIVNATAGQNRELFAALKGGGNKFGVVTAFTLRAHPQGEVWGGVIAFTGGNTPAMLRAIRDYTEYNTDAKAGIIATAELTGLNLVDIWILFLFYDAPAPPPGVFANFTQIPHLLDTTKRRSYHDLLTFNNGFVLKNQIYTIGTETTPLPAAEAQPVMQELYSAWHTAAASVARVSGVVASLAFQPLPKSIPAISTQAGGLVTGWDTAQDRIVLELDYSYWYPRDNAAIDGAMNATIGGLKGVVERNVAAKVLPEVKLPLFMNDGYFRQDYWGRIGGGSREKWGRIRRKFDAQGLWSRTGGFAL